MELIEREAFLTRLQSQFETISDEGHCVFVSGEAGIGKTSLIKFFCRQHKGDCSIYQGSCDPLFTPRPLAPLYDIIWQVNNDLWPGSYLIDERSELFSSVFRELSSRNEKTIVVFEDIHWADEACFDFIKFFARRISQLKCLFILTYREDEIDFQQSLQNVLGQIPPDSFTKLHLTPLSKQAVETMSHAKGFDGEDVFSITGGNPFYVNEILASYSEGVPENIKDSVLSVYKRQKEDIRKLWELLSVMPTGISIEHFENISALQQSLDASVLLLKEGILSFKHELYRRTIEASLTAPARINYIKEMLGLLLKSDQGKESFAVILHLAANANDDETILHYAPLAAKEAALVGSHAEAAKLYLTAIEHYSDSGNELLCRLYESYAYECYLTNQINEAINYMERSLALWKETTDKEGTGNCLRFLSRLWWFEGKRREAEQFGEQAIAIFAQQPSSRAKAMALSNMSQLKMLSDEVDECVTWGEKAVSVARDLRDEETHAHALNSMGSALMTIESSMPKGILLLRESLAIALQNGYHEHVARAYTALGSNGVTMKDYSLAEKALNEGINYCEEKDLDSFRLYMLSWKARMLLETGNWNDAYLIADDLIRNDRHTPVIKIGALVVAATIRFRKGEGDAGALLLEAKKRAFETSELQRIMPVLSAFLEYEWITGRRYIENDLLDRTMAMISQVKKISDDNKFYYWLGKARLISKRSTDAGFWEKKGCPYEQALALFDGNDTEKRKAISIMHALGASTVYERMKLEMRTSGIRNIPRGIRKSTQSNAAQLTGRELDILALLKEGLQNKEIAAQLYISAKTVDHHISSILFKLNVNSRRKAVTEAERFAILK